MPKKSPKQERYLFYSELGQAMRDTRYPAAYHDVPDAMFDIEERYQQLIRLKAIGLYISLTNIKNWYEKNKDTITDDGREWYNAKMKELHEEKAKFDALHPKLSDECYQDLVMLESLNKQCEEVKSNETGTDKKDN